MQFLLFAVKVMLTALLFILLHVKQVVFSSKELSLTLSLCSIENLDLLITYLTQLLSWGYVLQQASSEGGTVGSHDFLLNCFTDVCVM